MRTMPIGARQGSWAAGQPTRRAPRAGRTLLGLGVVALPITLGAIGWSCNDDAFNEPLLLGGKKISPSILNRGLVTYRRYCVGCHGLKGDGQASSASSMDPPPRDFTSGVFKFRSVPRDRLPTDEDLIRTIRFGLRGTHMPGWSSLPADEAQALIEYIKTFSPRWRTERPGSVVPLPPDPWLQGRRAAAIKRGEVVYHVQAQCWSCHPAYATRQELLSMNRQEHQQDGNAAPPSVPLRDELSRSREVVCSFGRVRPPDFLQDTLRASRSSKDLYHIIAAGIGGTPMPSWYKELSAADLWAVVHYIQELVRIKGTPQARALRKRISGS